MPSRNELIEGHLKYAKAAATKFTLGAPRHSVQWKDAYSVACEALVRAADAFDPTRGVSFGSFAWACMRNEIVDYRKEQRLHWGVDVELAELVSEPSAEDLLIAAERQDVNEDRLSRLQPEQRARVEDMLDGHGFGVRNAARMAADAGVRVARSALPSKLKLTGAEKASRYRARVRARKGQSMEVAA